MHKQAIRYIVVILLLVGSAAILLTYTRPIPPEPTVVEVNAPVLQPVAAEKKTVVVSPLTHCCVPTDGWKAYAGNGITLNYPPNFTVENSDFENSVAIGLKTIYGENEFDAYAPDMTVGIDIYPMQNIPACNDFFEENCKLDRSVENLLKSRFEYPTPAWQSMFPFGATDGHAPNEFTIKNTEIGGKDAIHFWFSNWQGIEGYALSDNSLLIKIDDTHLLPIRGHVQNAPSGIDHFAILETIYSTIRFK